MRVLDLGFDYYNYKPPLVVSDRGEVWVDNMFQSRFVSDSDVTTRLGYYRLDGLPPIVKAYIGQFDIHTDNDRHTDIIMLTENGELMIVNREYPHGYIVESSPIKELMVYENIFVLDTRGRLRYLEYDNQLSDHYIPNVKLYTYSSFDQLVVVDNNDILYLFPGTDLGAIPLKVRLGFGVKWLLHGNGYTFVVDYGHNVWKVDHESVIQVASISIDITHVLMIHHKYIYAIDVDGNLFRYSTRGDDTVQIKGNYNGFRHVLGHSYIIDGDDNELFVTGCGLSELGTSPFRLSNLNI